MLRVLAREMTGLIIIRDRKPDGSYVLLECEEFAPSGGGGVIADPDEDEEFPMMLVAERKLEDHAERSGAQPFRLDIDLSEMPEGELRFYNREFVEQAVEHAGVGEVAITPEDAESWGYIGQDRSRER